MASKELKITLDLDNGPAKAAALAFRADQQALNQGLLTDARQAENAKVAVARDAAGRFIAASKNSTDSIRADFKSQAEAARTSTGSIAAGFGQTFAAVSAGVSAAGAGFALLTKLAGGLKEAVDKAFEAQAKLGRDYSAKREGMGTLAALQGVKLDSAFMLEQAKFATVTGMTPQEATALQVAFANSGQQFVGEGKSMGAAEAKDYQKKLGNYAIAKGLDPGVVADLGGRMLGMKSYAKFGALGDEAALGDVSQVLSVLSSGQGEEGKLATEVAKLAGFSLNEDALKGYFQSPTDIAKLISTTAEFKDMGQAEAAASALRALRGFDRKKGGGTLKAAGVGRADDPFEAIRKVGEYAEAEAARGPAGTKPQDILNAGFDDSLAAEVIGGLYGKGFGGPGGGVFAARDATAAANAGPLPALQLIDKFKQSEAGVDRTRRAQGEMIDVERGAETSKVTLLRQEAINRLRKDKLLDTTDANISEFIGNSLNFGLIGDAKRDRIDREVVSILKQRGGAAGVKQLISDGLPFTSEARADKFNAAIGEIEATGRSATTDRPPMSEAQGNQIIAELKKLNEGPPQAPPPRPIMPAPAVMSR